MIKTTFSLALILCSSVVLAVQPYCQPGYKPIGDKDLQLDLSKLNKDFIVFQNETTPPTVTSIMTQINLCDPLNIPDEPENHDICPKGTLICRRIINVKNNVETVNVVQPVARDIDNKLNVEFKPVRSEDDATKSGYQYSISLNGGEYNQRAQSALVTLECDESQSRNDEPKSPVIISYNNNVLTLQWKTIFACATKAGEKVPDDKPSTPPPSQGDNTKEGMSGIGIFFTILFVLAGVYFVGGAVYNYKMYNARGLDLIPHRDFWFDLPYLIRDLIAHIIDSVMSRRRGAGGYVAV